MRKLRGKRLRSTYEERIRADLEARQIPYQYETLKLNYVKDYCPHCKEPTKRGVYTPDFIIGTLIVEAKGRFTSIDRTKMLNVKRDNPTLRLALLFQRDNKLTKASKTSYTQWATNHGFPSAIGESVPQEWLGD